MTPRPLAAGRRLAARTPLQVKLIVAVLALVTVALALIGLASVAALDGYLIGRLDDQLQAVAQVSAGEGPHPGPAIVTVVGPTSALTYEDESANQCRRVTYVGGQGFVDRGFGHVHRAVAGPNGADFYVTYLLPPGSESHVISATVPDACSS